MALARIDYDTWATRLSRPVLEDAGVSFFERSQGGAVDEVLVAATPQSPVGFVVATPRRDVVGEPIEMITAIAVDRFWRRRRVASALILAAAVQARRHGLERLSISVPRSHDAMQRLVVATGFERDRRVESDAQIVAVETQWTLLASQAQSVGERRLRA